MASKTSPSARDRNHAVDVLAIEGLHVAVTEIKNKNEIRDQRIEILEKHAQQMQSIPATVSGLNAKVDGLQENMLREVDGLRQQQKAHKDEMSNKVDAGFIAVGVSITALGTKVDGMQVRDTRIAGIRDFLFNFGAFLVGTAAVGLFIIEIIKLLK